MTTIYHYHPANGEYLGSSEAALDPLDNLPLIPAHATDVAPPSAGSNEIPVFEAGAWTMKPDYRGTKYWLPDGSEHDITNIGISPPSNALSSPPPPPIDQVRADAIADVKADAGRRILTQYPDWKQRNMTARGVELTMIIASGGALTAAETTEQSDLQAAWGWIKRVRAASDAAEIEILAASDATAIAAVTPAWPTDTPPVL